MKRGSAVTLSIATAALTLFITQFAAAQTAPSNTTPCSMQETAPAIYLAHDWFNSLLPQPCAAMQQAVPSDDTSSAAEQNAPSAEAMQTAMEMVPAQAFLDQTVDGRNAQQGEQIKATLSNKIQLKNGPELPSGTDLIGQVSVAQMQNDGTYKLAFVFTNAQLKNGTVIPIKATIVGVHAPVIYDSLNSLPLDLEYPPTNNWNDRTLQVNQTDALGGVDLLSRIAGSNSGTFVSKKKDDILLPTQGVLDLAIAAQGKS